MKKTVGIVVLLLCVTASMGCIFKGNSLPAQGSELQMAMDTTATYDVIGPAEGEYTRGYLFSLIPLKDWFSTSQGTIVAPMPSPPSPYGIFSVFGMLFSGCFEKAWAIYNAIESVPDADAIMAPRYHTTSSNYILYREVTVKVKGKAIRFNASSK